MQKFILLLFTVLLINLTACQSLRLGTSQRKTEYPESDIPVVHNIVPKPQKANYRREIQIDGYLFMLFITPDPPTVQDEVEIDLAVQEIKTKKAVTNLKAGCRAIMQEHMFITRCEQPHEKDSMGHYPMAIKYSAAGDWQIRFEIETPEGKLLEPTFTVSVK